MKQADYKFFINHSDEKVQQIATLKRKIGGSFLDVGAGEGTITEALIPFFSRVDIVEEKERSCQNLAKKGIVYHNVKFEDFETNNRYNVILASHLLTYIDNKKKAIEKMFSLLKVGGKLYIFNMSYSGLMETIKHMIHPDPFKCTDKITQKIVSKYPKYEREVIPINLCSKTVDEMLRLVHFLSEKREDLWEKNKDKITELIEQNARRGQGYEVGYYNILYTIYKI